MAECVSVPVILPLPGAAEADLAHAVKWHATALQCFLLDCSYFALSCFAAGFLTGLT